ncbi:MAG TPA: LamG domain-containing protein [Phycisphaerales bacterium]|nr:LamG domain-containing protein [Phycisphaerales bacterium]
MTRMFRVGCAVCCAAVGSVFAHNASAATLLHYYPFSSDANDAVGGANGTLLGGSSITGGTLQLDGSTGYVQFGSHIVPTSGSYSVAMFAKADFLPTGVFELISQGSSGGPGFYIGKDATAQRFIRASDSWQNTGVQYPNDGAMHHFALVVNSATSSSLLYLDGQAVATGPLIATTTGGSDTRLGRQFGGIAEFFPGTLDEVRVYSGALTGAEVAALIPAPSPILLLFSPLVAAAAKRRRASVG